MIHWAEDVSDTWGEVLAELTRAFEVSRAAAQAEESIVYVVHQDSSMKPASPVS